MSKFTEGPWENSGSTISKPTVGVIARCPSPSPPNGDGVIAFIANARLIAAAPEMYSALTELETLVERSLPPQVVQTGGGIDVKKLLTDTRELLARIDGEGQ